MTEQTNGPHRSCGERTPEDYSTVSLYKAVFIPVMVVLIIIVIISLGMTVGWLTTFLITMTGLIVIIAVIAMRNWDRIGLFLGNYAAREAAEEENRRHFEAAAQPSVTNVTEEEINDVEGIMGFAEDITTGEPLDPPPVIRWQWLGVAFIWVLNLWPFYFWPRYFWQYLSQHPSEDATDRAEDWMWLGFFVAIPGLMFIGWGSEGSSIPFWVVLISYAGSGLTLWAILTYRRNTAT